MKTITQLEFSGEDMIKAEAVAGVLGYAQTAYTSTSALIGLFCLPDGPEHTSGCVIKTAEFGLMFVQDLEDLGIRDEIETIGA